MAVGLTAEKKLCWALSGKWNASPTAVTSESLEGIGILQVSLHG